MPLKLRPTCTGPTPEWHVTGQAVKPTSRRGTAGAGKGEETDKQGEFGPPQTVPAADWLRKKQERSDPAKTSRPPEGHPEGRVQRW